jgi:hypothetical protein
MKPRVMIALLTVFLYASFSSARAARRAAEWPARPGQDAISAYTRRFDSLRWALPTTGEVGYLGSPDPKSPAPATGASPALLHFRRFLLAQYALAPLLLVENTSPEFVIGNFEPGLEPPPPAGFRRAASFGDGVVLFRRAEP